MAREITSDNLKNSPITNLDWFDGHRQAIAAFHRQLEFEAAAREHGYRELIEREIRKLDLK